MYRLAILSFFQLFVVIDLVVLFWSLLSNMYCFSKCLYCVASLLHLPSSLFVPFDSPLHVVLYVFLLQSFQLCFPSGGRMLRCRVLTVEHTEAMTPPHYNVLHCLSTLVSIVCLVTISGTPTNHVLFLKCFSLEKPCEHTSSMRGFVRVFCRDFHRELHRETFQIEPVHCLSTSVLFGVH